MIGKKHIKRLTQWKAVHRERQYTEFYEGVVRIVSFKCFISYVVLIFFVLNPFLLITMGTHTIPLYVSNVPHYLCLNIPILAMFPNLFVHVQVTVETNKFYQHSMTGY